MTYRMLKGAIMYFLFVFVIMCNVHELFAISREREERMEAKQSAARLYMSAKPFESWIETSPDGEPVQFRLYTAWREGTLLWVLREGGHYIEADSIAEFTVDRELCFEEGMSLLWNKRRVIDDSTPEYVEE